MIRMREKKFMNILKPMEMPKRRMELFDEEHRD